MALKSSLFFLAFSFLRNKQTELRLSQQQDRLALQVTLSEHVLLLHLARKKDIALGDWGHRLQAVASDSPLKTVLRDLDRKPSTQYRPHTPVVVKR